jgi:hypothetical protein
MNYPNNYYAGYPNYAVPMPQAPYGYGAPAPMMPTQYGATPYAYNNASRAAPREVRLYPFQEDYALSIPMHKNVNGRKEKLSDAEKLIRFEKALHIETAMYEKKQKQGIDKSFNSAQYNALKHGVR